MPDPTQSWLATWILAAHLTPEVRSRCRNQFAARRLLVLDRFLAPRIAEEVSLFLNLEAPFKTAYALYSSDSASGTITGVSREEWLQAEASRRFFRFGELDPSRLGDRNSANQASFHTVVNAMRDERFRLYCEEITGIGLASGPKINAYSYGAGDFLGPHCDNDKNRTLAFVLYFTHGWDARFGGELNLIEADDKVTVITAEHNRLVLFDVRTGGEHRVSSVSSDAGSKTRTSIGGWFLSGGPPEE
jgi:hypothetical protein